MRPSSIATAPAVAFSALLLVVCWLGMQVVHEAGHVAAAWGSGGVVTGVVLHPLAISRTDVEPNPHPLLVVWGGPIVGVALPLVMWPFIACVGRRAVPAWRFFAGFCLIANGVYIGSGIVEPVGDANDLLRYGSSPLLLVMFAVATVPAGFGIWNGQAAHFGFGENSREISWRDGAAMFFVLALIVFSELVWTRVDGSG